MGFMNETDYFICPMRHSADPFSGLETEALFGEDITICDDSDPDWVHVRLETDQYLAWIERQHLGVLPTPTHIAFPPYAR